ncbi:MAG TPA: hypothetical protein VF411_15665 [Bacteroidia bacterium]
MKKITVIASLFIAVLTTSCTKSHVCTCVTTPTSGTAYTSVTTFDKITMANAAEACQQNSSQTVTTMGSATQTSDKVVCTLK